MTTPTEYSQIHVTLLRAILDHIEKIEYAVGSQAQQSSVEVKTSTRGYDIAVKAYVGSPIQSAGDEAVNEYIRVRDEIEQRLMGPVAA
jgi:hypothetical protein